MRNFPQIAAAGRLIASCRPPFQMMSGVSAPLAAAHAVNNNARASAGGRLTQQAASGARGQRGRGESRGPVAPSVKVAVNPAAGPEAASDPVLPETDKRHFPSPPPRPSPGARVD